MILYNGVLLYIPSLLQWPHVGSLKLAILWQFTPQKLAKLQIGAWFIVFFPAYESNGQNVNNEDLT